MELTIYRPENAEDEMSIIEELDATVRKYRKYARRNYYAVYILYVLAVVASIAATFLALVGSVPSALLATVSAVPGAALLILQTFRLGERAAWHYQKKNRLNALRRLAVTRSDATSQAEVARKWNEIDEDMEKVWPSFGAFHKTTSDTNADPNN